MKANDITGERLRELARVRPDGAKVLSLYLDIDPTRFGTFTARQSAFTSLVEEAQRRVEDVSRDVSHDELMTLREDVGRAEEALRGGLPLEGADAVALFASGQAGLFEALRLPRPVAQRAIVDDVPHIKELARIGPPDVWCVTLVNRRVARLLFGTQWALSEAEQLRAPESRLEGPDDRPDTRGMRVGDTEHERDSVLDRHLRGAAEALRDALQEDRYEQLLVGAPTEWRSPFEAVLHPSVHDRLAGFVSVDVEHTSPDDVLAAASDGMNGVRAERERAVLERFQAGLAAPAGRAAAGLDETLLALTEQRVEALILQDDFARPGVRCPTCGWLGVDADRCPADGTPLQHLEDVAQAAVARAIDQDAAVLIVDAGTPVDPRGGIGAILRF
jgi:hypothetical protein